MKVEQENFLASDLAVGPATAQTVGHEALHRAGEIGVHYDGTGFLHARGGPNTNGAPAFEEHFFAGVG